MCIFMKIIKCHCSSNSRFSLYFINMKYFEPASLQWLWNDGSSDWQETFYHILEQKPIFC